MTGAIDDLHFRELVEAAPAIVFVARPDGTIAYANRAWTTFSGIPVERVLEHGWSTVVYPDDAVWVGDAWMRSMADSTPFREEFRISDASGEPRWVVANAVPTFAAGGEVTYWYGTVNDVDARRSAENALSSLTDAIPHLVWTNDAFGDAIHVNRRWIEYTGLSYQESLGRGWMSVLHPDDVAIANEQWAEALVSGVFRADRPLRLRRHDGVYRWFVGHAVAVRDETGTIQRWYGTNTDIDDEYRASQRRAIMVHLGSAFAESLDFERTARTVVTAMCKEFADFAFLDVLGTDGRLSRVAAETGQLVDDPKRYRGSAPLPDARDHPINVALKTARPSIVAGADNLWIDAPSVVHVPMIAAGERIGVLTFGAAHGTGRSFSQADLDDIEEVARRAAIALANARLYADLVASEARYRGIIDTAQEGVWIVDAEGRTTYVNQRLCEVLGYTADEMFGKRLTAFMDRDARRDADVAFERLRAGETGRFEGRMIHRDGRVLWAIIAASPIRDAHHRFAGALGMLTDITDRKAIETQYRLLTEATPQIVWTADPRGMMTFVNERWTALTGMPREEALGYGWCAMVYRADLAELLTRWRSARERNDDFEAECRLQRSGDRTYRWHLVRARARRDEESGETVEWLGSMTDIDAGRRLAKTRDVVARAGDVLSRSLDVDALLGRFAELLVAELAAEATIRLAGGATIVRARERLEPGSPTLQTSLRHRDAIIGSIALRSHEPFGDDDAALLEELAARAAIAVENARLYEREHRVAVTLQHALLPAVLPQVGGLTFDAVYSPGATEAEIGGDWYDAIALHDGRVVVSIGDVTGRGLTAAVIMGRMRQAIETLATYETDPVRLLDAADAVLRRAHPEAIVTALVGVIDPAAHTLTYATAGHPTPFVRAPDGTVRSLPGRGLPLGLRDGGQAPASTLVLPPGALTVFFTDGLTESTRDIDEGERRVLAALHDPKVTDGPAPAAALLVHVLDGAVRDDVAVLTVRVADAAPSARAWTMRWRFDPSDRQRSYDVREALVETLANFGHQIDIAAAQLVFGELVGNALRHAPGAIDVELTWDDPATPILHVVDDGPGYAAPTGLPAHEAESGRGLFLVRQLTRDFSVRKHPERGAHARAVLYARD